MKINEIITESYQPPELEVGDKILKGKFKNSPAEIKGFKQDKHNQPVLKTNKGDVQLFKPRIDKLDVHEDSDPCWDNYKQVGMKKKGGRKVPNCVPKEGVAEGNVEEALQAPPTSTGNSLLDEFIEMYVSKGWKYHGTNKRGGHEFRKRRYMPAALYGLEDGGVIESFNNGTRVSIFDKSGKRVKKLADGPLSEQGVAEGSEQNVVKSVKVGNFRHDLVNTGMGWQVRIYNGDELYDTGLSKNSEEKGLAALDDSVAYTKKQLNIKEQGVAEGWKQKVGAGLTAAALATGASGVVLNPARPIGPRGQTVANPYPNKGSNTKSPDDAWAKIEKRKAQEKLKEFAPSDGGGGENPYDPLSFPEFKTMLTLKLAGNTKGIIVSRGSDSGMAKISINASHRIVPLNIHGVVNAVKFIKNVKSKEIPEQGVAGGQLEETYDNDDEFFEAYGVMEYNDQMINESEYQGRKVTLNKPMQGDVKKFKVYVKNPKGNVVKVNFGDPNSTIKKNNPARRKSFRARHNCDNPGPKTGARYWSCRKW